VPVGYSIPIHHCRVWTLMSLSKRLTTSLANPGGFGWDPRMSIRMESMGKKRGFLSQVGSMVSMAEPVGSPDNEGIVVSHGR